MKPLIFTLILIALFSCKENKKQDIIDTESIYSNSWIKDIKLNNGLKWKANVETNEGVEKMQNSIKSQSTKTLAEYYKLAEILNRDKNYVIKKCSMKGDSHDNLHVWLLPLMSKINALSDTKSIEVASKLKQSIQENIDAYHDYFN
jgi:hypothetical protein